MQNLQSEMQRPNNNRGLSEGTAAVIRRTGRIFLFLLVSYLFLNCSQLIHAQTQSRFYYAIENLDSGQVTRRGTTTSAGIPSNGLILAPLTNYREWLFNAGNGFVGFTDFTTPTSGSTFSIPPITLRPPLTPDSDGDGLSDDAEFVVGSNPANPYSIVPGILDGVAVQQGLSAVNALQTGIIGATATAGKAVDVCAFNDIVVVADSDHGVFVFNVFNQMSPLIIAQSPTPAPVLAVGLSANLIAAACGTGGLVVLDVSKPPDLPIIHQISLGGSAQAVTVGGGIAYVGLDSSQVVSVDLASGIVVDNVAIPGSVQDLAISGDTLYALTADTLYALSLTNDNLQVSGSVSAPGTVPIPRRRLFVGTGLAYAGHGRGYTIFSLANPNAPTLVNDVITAQLGWKQIVANGSGVGVAAVGVNRSDDGAHDISLYSLDPAGTNNVFLTTFTTPGIASAVCIYNGLAYVGDGLSGLEVINYLAYDTSNHPPAIALSPSFPLTSRTNASVVEGQRVRVTANVSDDVQVRNVEFYINGGKAATDGNFPFEYFFTTPSLSSGGSFTLQARASDTGGNFTWSDLITVNLLPDTAPPRVRRTFPGTNAIVDNTDSFLIFFNKPVDTNTLNAGNIQVTWAGADSQLGTGDDSPVTNALVTFRDGINAAVFTGTNGLNNGLYHVNITANLADVAGNHLTNATSYNFWILRGGPGGDADSDGLTNALEVAYGFNPINADTDGDGWDDGVEFVEGANFVTNALLRPRQTFVARPPATVSLPGPDELGLPGAPITFAHPPVTAIFPGIFEMGLVGAGLTVGYPPLQINFPDNDEMGLLGSGLTVAHPPLLLQSPGLDETGIVGNGITIAKPPLSIQFPADAEAGTMGVGVTVAKPPVTVTLPSQ